MDRQCLGSPVLSCVVRVANRFRFSLSWSFYLSSDDVHFFKCVWWGHPVTASTGAIDFFLSLDAELDEGQADYLEQMVRMEYINTAVFTQASRGLLSCYTAVAV